jgi:hypothetical protein
MDRKDSGFVESFSSTSQNKPSTNTPNIHRSNTAPNRLRQPGKASPKSNRHTQSVDMHQQYSASESRSRPSNHRSTTSSSENSTTKSKGRGHGSKPSSRRTSCTIVDPSRPARHYRIKSSQSIATATGQDVDDVLALHFRSCSLFQNPSYHSRSGLPSPTPSPTDKFTFPTTTSRLSSDEMNLTNEPMTPESETGMLPATTTHWMSPSTRQREYERIDRANTGLRGMIRRAVPRCVSGPQEKFYENDQSDAGSVRRYRLDPTCSSLEEKKMARITTRSSSRPAIKSRWSCF